MAGMIHYVDYICAPCGFKHGRYRAIVSSYWNGECDVCFEKTAVTQGRDYGVYWINRREWGDESSSSEV